MTHDTPTGPSSTEGKEALREIGSVAADIQATATQKFDETVEDAKAKAHDAKDAVAEEVNTVATALRHASEELRDGSTQERVLGQIASTIADASDALRNRDIGEIFQWAGKVARDNPALFLSGAALLGFAASRYAKASSEHSDTPHSRPQSQSPVSAHAHEAPRRPDHGGAAL